MSKARDDKWDYNFQQLLVKASHHQLHVPVQFGMLSQELRKVKYLDSVLVQEDGIERTEYKLLQIIQPSRGAGRKLIWRCVKVMPTKDEQESLGDDEEYYEYSFQRYDPVTWNRLKYQGAQRPKVVTP